jgi:glycosyltransferase involved in cell wall biosynthesis
MTIAVNAGAADNLLWAGARPDRLVRMMYGAWGVDTDEFTPDGPPAVLPGAGAPRIVFLGRFVREKGVFDLVAAMPEVLEHAKADLVFIGDGPEAGALRRAAHDAGVAEFVHFVDTIKNEEVPSHLRAAAVLAAPSQTTQKWAEQVGMSALQALACGVPVVSTNSGSIPEFIEDGVSGLLVAEANPHALATALTRLVADDTTRREFAKRARAQALRRFDARTNIRAAERRILEACGYPI